MNIPATQQALVCENLAENFSGLKLIETPVPAIANDSQVLIKVAAASLNYPDVLMTMGKYQFKPPMPFVPCMEGSGTVIQSTQSTHPESTEFPVGSKVVFGSLGDRVGICAQYLTARPDQLRPLPTTLTLNEGACFYTGFLTAWASLVGRGQIKATETVMIHGSCGGVGLAAVLLAKHLGCRVIATGTSQAKLAQVEQAGADHCILLPNGDTSTLKDQVAQFTDNKMCDVIYDPVGGDVFDASVRCIAWGGRLLVVGFASGRIPQIPVNMPLIKGFSVVGVRAGEMGRRDPEFGVRSVQETWGLADHGLKPIIGQTYPLEQAVLAFEDMFHRRIVGKSAILCNDD